MSVRAMGWLGSLYHLQEEGKEACTPPPGNMQAQQLLKSQTLSPSPYTEAGQQNGRGNDVDDGADSH